MYQPLLLLRKQDESVDVQFAPASCCRLRRTASGSLNPVQNPVTTVSLSPETARNLSPDNARLPSFRHGARVCAGSSVVEPPMLYTACTRSSKFFPRIATWAP